MVVSGHSTRAYGAIQTAKRVRRLPRSDGVAASSLPLPGAPYAVSVDVGGSLAAHGGGSLVALLRLCDKAGVTSGPA